MIDCVTKCVTRWETYSPRACIFSGFVRTYMLAPLLSILVFIVSCTNTTPEVASQGSPDPVQAQDATKKPIGCPHKEAVCPEVYAPSVCVVDAYDSKPLPEAAIMRIWGQNSCMAKSDLAVLACQRGLDPAQFGDIKCSPDASKGKCPPVRSICTMNYQPSRCVAKAYGDQDLKSSQFVEASGSNECDARNNLLMAACVRNLNPEKLSKITCASEEGSP